MADWINKSINKLAKYFPTTTSHSLTGEVNNNSRVPSFCSSESNFIVIRGAKNIIKEPDQFEIPLTLASAKGLVISNTKKTPVSTKNIAPTM